MRKIKKNDAVVILSGGDAGKTGKVLTVLDKGQRVTVEKCKMVKRHSKPTQQYRTGGIIEKEAPIHISNVSLVGSDGRAARVGFRTQDEGERAGKSGGGKHKTRFSRKHDQAFD